MQRSLLRRARLVIACGLIVFATGACSPDQIVYHLFRHHGASEADARKAVDVADCETGGTWNPAAQNGSHRGWFQISKRYHEWRARALGFTWDQMTDGTKNTMVAIHLWREQGWGPWSCA